MTPRERVLAALEHREPDRIPVDLSGHRSSGIAALAYPRLRACLGLPPTTVRVYDPVQQLAIVDDDVLDRLGVDTVELGRGFALDESHWADWELPDGSPCKMPAWALPERVDGAWVFRSPTGRAVGRMPPGVVYFEQCHWPFLDQPEDLDDLPAAFAQSMWHGMASPPGPLGADPDALAAGAAALRARTDRAIIGLFGGNLLETGQWLYRMDHFMMMLAGEPGRVHAFLDRLVELHLASLERFLKAVGPSIDVILFGDDLGMQSGPQMSTAMYRAYFKPRQAAMWKRAKELADVKVMLHCCGGVRPLLPDLIDAGLDAINPVQVNCKGMEAEGLKRDFGRDITFWGGGCDTQRILSHGTPSEVRAHVRRQVATLAPGGGFVFQQVHNILADIPAENVVAMYEAARGS